MRETMTERYILDDNNEPVTCEDLMTWARWIEVNPDKKRVARTVVAEGVEVSTVFLGLDHSFGDGPPVLWETMIFGGEHDQYQERFTVTRRCGKWASKSRGAGRGSRRGGAGTGDHQVTEKQIARLKELDKSATQAPWAWDGREVAADGWVSIPQGSHLGETLIALDDTYEGYQADCDLITETRNALPELLAELTSLRATLAAREQRERELFKAGFMASPNADEPERWVFNWSSAADREAEAWAAYQAWLARLAATEGEGK